MRSIALALALVAGCTGIAAVDEIGLDLEDPEPTPARPTLVPDAIADVRDPCAGATGHVAALCSAESYDGDCVGMSCGRTESRTAIECLLEEGFPTERFAELARARNPATRAYARSALLRRDALAGALLEEALADEAVVLTYDGCLGDYVGAGEAALVAQLPAHARAPGPGFDPLIARWMHAHGCRSIVERIEDARDPAERERLLELEAKMRAAQ